MQNNPQVDKTTPTESIEYDGFYFYPDGEDDESECVTIQFFRFIDEVDVGEKVDFTKEGDMFHVVFFQFKDDALAGVDYDGEFEGIFADPVVYIRNMGFSDLCGCFLRKTTKSRKWFEDYLKQSLANLLEIKNEAAKVLGANTAPI